MLENTLQVDQAATDEDILATRDVMCQLRPNVPKDRYLDIVRAMMRTDSYRLAAVRDGEVVRAVAGYRVMEMLYCGKILYVDDLNTDERFRSNGYGKRLMDWLKEEARGLGCREIHLDSGTHREQTHRFYFREGLTVNCFHFHGQL